MQSTKRFKLTFGILSVSYIILGIMLLVAPDVTKSIICVVLGIAAVIVGIIRVAYFFLRKDPARAFGNDLAVGAVLLLAGVYLIAWPGQVIDLLSVLLGFTIVFDSVIKLQYALEFSRIGFAQWWVVLAVALGTTVLGVLLVVGVFTLVTVWGVVLLIDGIANLSTMILLTFLLHRFGKGEGKAKKLFGRKKKTGGELFEEDEEAETKE